MRNNSAQDAFAAATHVDRAWRDAFVVELRLLDVSGERIGDALMTVESHVRESGESAEEAFGDPREYASSLADRLRPSRRTWSAALAAGNLLGLAGLLLTTSAVDGWFSSGVVDVRVGNVVAFVFLMLVAGAMIMWLDRFLRLVIDHMWWVALAFGVVPALLVIAPTLLLRQSVGYLPALPLGIFGVALVVVGSIVAYRETGTHDAIIIPGQTTGGGRVSARVLTAFAFPFALAVSLLIGAIPRLFA